MFGLHYALDIFCYSNKDDMLFSGFLLELECDGTTTAMINIPGLQKFPELPQSETIPIKKQCISPLPGFTVIFFLTHTSEKYRCTKEKWLY